MSFLKKIRKLYKNNLGKHSKAVRRKLGLTGKKMKKALGLDSRNALASSVPTSASTFHYQPRPISSLM